MIQSLYSKIKAFLTALRPTEKLVFGMVSIALLISLYSLFGNIRETYSTETPTQGGTYTEGIIGYARFINPLLSYTDADKDMTSLIYSGLLKPTPEGKLVADLAKTWEVSSDGLTYTFILKDNIFFHDNTPVTTDDVEFTIEKAQDPLIKSLRADNWNGVKVEKISPTEIRFTLKKPYSPFLENMTLGILPKHLWSSVDHDVFDIHTLNREPVGSGPYKIKKAYKNESGIYDHYDLVPFEKYSLGKAYIDHIVIKFYKNESDAIGAYKDGTINGLGSIEPNTASELKAKNYSLMSVQLPRVFALFFNQSSAPVFVNKEVRQALDVSVDRNSLINDILKGWGTPSKGPIPQGLTADTITAASSSDQQLSAEITSQYIEAGKKILTSKGWKLNSKGIFEKVTKSGKTSSTQTLSFSISTSNIPELKRTAEILKDTWTKLGADVKVEIFEPSDLTQKVIRPRKYDSLLFGNVVGRDLDLYPFWHSSQRNDPGLNIALYTNIKADKALETIRNTGDEVKKTDAYKAFENEIQNDIPAVFLYSPEYIYATTNTVKNLQLSNITSPAERFIDVSTWYVNTAKVWNFFSK